MPHPGEVWTFSGMEAVVVSVLNDGRVDLVGRTGRRVVLTERTMGHLWTCKQAQANPAPCSTASCESRGYVGDRFGGWFCGSHVPRNQPLLFPGDDPLLVESFMRGMFVRCPVCRQKQERDPSQKFVDGFIIFICNLCHAGWTVLLGQGVPEDGQLFIDDTLRAIGVFTHILGGACGSAAYGAIRRTVYRAHPAKDGEFVIAGVKVKLEETYGPFTLALFGTPKFYTEEGRPQINVGDEYASLTTDTLYRVESLTETKVVLKDTTKGDIVVVWSEDFPQFCRKLIRRTSYEILMSDDDLV